MNNQTEIFENFCFYFGKLIAEGLNQQPVEVQRKIASAMESGARMYAVVHPMPVSIQVKIANQDSEIEIFRVGEQIN